MSLHLAALYAQQKYKKKRWKKNCDVMRYVGGSYAIWTELEKIRFWQQKNIYFYDLIPNRPHSDWIKPGSAMMWNLQYRSPIYFDWWWWRGEPKHLTHNKTFQEKGVKWLISVDRETNKQTHSVLSLYYSKHATKNLHVGTIKHNKTPKAEQV